MLEPSLPVFSREWNFFRFEPFQKSIVLHRRIYYLNGGGKKLQLSSKDEISKLSNFETLPFDNWSITVIFNEEKFPIFCLQGEISRASEHFLPHVAWIINFKGNIKGIKQKYNWKKEIISLVGGRYKCKWTRNFQTRKIIGSGINCRHKITKLSRCFREICHRCSMNKSSLIFLHHYHKFSSYNFAVYSSVHHFPSLHSENREKL